MRQSIFVILFLLLVVAGCRGSGDGSPTPFPTSGPTATLSGTGPIELTVTELMSAPGLYRDVQIRLTGLLRKQPVIICDTDLHPSPATWGLGEEGVLALAGGYDQQVRSLLPDELGMTVEGRWRRWEGIVGCGKQAQQREVWYLEASRIVSPSPLTQVTLTPASGVEIVAVTSGATLAVEPTGTIDLGVIETPTTQFPVETDTPEGMPGSPTPTIELAVTQSPSALTPTVTISSTLAGTSQFTVTPGGTPSPTVPGGTPATPTTPTATTASSGQVVAKGNLFEEMFGDFITSSLPGGTIDSWEVDLFEEEQLFVYVIAPTPADIILSVLKDGQPIVNRQNTAPPGATEFINNPALPGEGIYEIQVLTTGGTSTDYALTFFTDPESATILFPGIINPGQPRSAVQLPLETYHYWFFTGNSGDDVTITLTPLGEEDPAVYLFGPDAEEMESADDGFEGDAETLEVTLALSGLHAILIEEVYGETLNYNLELIIPQ